MEPDPVFQKALDNFKEELTAQQRREFRMTNLQDVKDEVKKIQNQHGSAKKLRGMSRMSKFLEAMQQLEQVISVFLNVSEVVAFIWGPIKFFLVVASSRLEILECLLDTFTDISEAMPDLQGYSSIFKDHPEVLEELKRCYGDIIRFYHMAFDVLGRPGAFGIRDWRRIFDSVWKTFRTKFSPVLASLRRHRELLEQVKSTATFGELQRTRLILQESIEKSYEELKQGLWGLQQKRKQILDKLGSQGSQNDKRHRRLPDQRHPTSGDWILKEQNFLQWLDPHNISKDLLYLNGMPGAGKTTLVSRVIDSMTEETTSQQRPLLTFYFEHGQSGKTLMLDMLRSFIEQLLQQDDAIVDDLHETMLTAGSSDLGRVSWVKDVANRLILAQKRCYMIVDGLDECPLDQRRPILEWLKTVLSGSKSNSVVMKVLVSGQRDGVIDAVLQDSVSTAIRLDNQVSHLRDIEAYSSSVLSQIKDRFPDLDDEEEILKRLDPSRITEASQGMFMYAKVVLDNFLSQTSMYELEQEVEREYPDGLDEAYDRVAERVLEKTLEPCKQTALQILRLIAVAARPLKWREIQCSFCIDATTGFCNQRKRKVGSAKDYCSSLVDSKACILFPDMTSEAQVVMVHNTAKSYLLRSKRLDMVQQHEQMSLFCLQYLTTPAFDLVKQGSKIECTKALTGFYGLFDYAAANWDHHVLQYVCQASLRTPHPLSKGQLDKQLSTAWENFANRFSDRHESTLEIASKYGETSDASVQQSIPPPGAIENVDESCNIEDLFRDWNSTRQSTEFESLATSIRRIMQQTDLATRGDREKDVYLALSGPCRDKCPRRACVHFNTGFDSESELVLHMSWHEMAFKCPHMGCYAWRTGFPTTSLLQTHLKRAHIANDPEERLFPLKSRNRPRTLQAACRLGDIELIRTFPIPMNKREDKQIADRALHTAAQDGHLAVCIHLAQHGANPYCTRPYGYKSERSHATISAVQMAIRLGDYDLFSALRSTAREHHESNFIEDTDALLECILDALESPIDQFLVELLACNDHRTTPLTLQNILTNAIVETQRQEYGCRTLSYIRRCVLIEDPIVRKRLKNLVSSELKRYAKQGHCIDLCYEKVLGEPSDLRDSLLHRLCDGGSEGNYFGAVKFMLTELRPQDTRRYNSTGNPPLFNAIRENFRAGETELNDQENIIRSFFENDLNGARNTHNADGQGPLEFSFRYAKFRTIFLIFELSGASYSALDIDDIMRMQPDTGPNRIRMVVGLGCEHEKIHMAVEFGREDIDRFIWWLTDLTSGPDVPKMLQSPILRPSRETMRADSANAVPTSDHIPHSDSSKAAKIVLTLNEAVALPKSCRPKPEDFGRMQLRKMVFLSFSAKLDRFDIANYLSEQHHTFDPGNAGSNDRPHRHELAARYRNSNIISLLRRNGGYTDFSSGETQSQLIQVLEDSIYMSKKAGTRYPNGLMEYIETLIAYAEAEGNSVFADSLENVRQRA